MITAYVIISILSLVITGGLLVAYFKLQKQYVALVKHEERLSRSKRVSRRTRKKAHKILDEAQDTAQKVIQESNLKAQNIISQTQLFSDEQRDSLVNQIQKYTNEQVTKYQSFIDGLKEESGRVLKNLADRIGTEASGEVDEFQNRIQKSIAQVDASIAQIVSNGVNQIQKVIDQSQKQALSAFNAKKQQVETEIELYKKQEMEKVESKIFEILEAVNKDLLEKSLNPREHEEIVIKSLERAKREKMFD
jgi:F0F1-type ATP synthase membrane subunit b/b'